MGANEKKPKRAAVVLQQLRKGEDPYPVTLEIHPTDICNQKCKYCFFGGRGYKSTRTEPKMDVEEYRCLFTEMKEIDLIELKISGGGEPLLHPQIVEILRSARETGLTTRLTTNGNFLEIGRAHVSTPLTF